MNAEVRVAVQESIFSQGLVIGFDLPELRVLVLVFLLLVSALGVVYVKDVNRCLFIDYQQLQIQQDKMKIDSSKLLLEQSAWSSEMRVQQIAEQQLQMQVPSPADVVVIKA